MVSLNGREIQVGDVVYDILKGAGKVTDNGGGVLAVTVDFGESGTMKFAQDGTFQGVQRLYWKAPYVFQPRGPSDEPYELAIQLSQLIYNFLVQYEKRKTDID